MQDQINFNQQRAEIYWWISSLLAHELTVEQLESYYKSDIQQFLSELGETPELSASITQIKNSIAALQLREDAQLELSADFCGLFLTTPKSAALPYASMYRGDSQQLNGQPAQEMMEWLKKFDIAQKSDFNEPTDHIAIQLDFLGNLILLSNQSDDETSFEALMQQQLLFINQQLLSWVPAFSQECVERDSFGFYASITAFLLAFIDLDKRFLSGE
ncbi:molecular chaperone TorD [Aliivibrio kagoshimensis]|uniref:molecular chaperone TorD n=1 Tax=Aliivibrio kagoshimensis TaxID=2910230 RepID=UPI003D1109B6